MEEMRLNKKLVELGVTSRRKADEMIERGLVTVNNEVATLGTKVLDTDIIEVDGKVIKNDTSKIILMYYKEKGVICTESDAEKGIRISDKIKSFGFKKRLFTVGRLDKDTVGLIIITNDGDLSRDILNTKNNYEKEYEVIVNKEVNAEIKKGLEDGVFLKDLNKTTKKCKVKTYKDDKHKFNITITQGLNRQVRRMCEAFNLRVIKLKRVRIINLKLRDLKPGEFKVIKKKDIYGK